MLQTISKTVEPFIKRDGGVVLAAVSGGADSVCLLMTMKMLFDNVVAMHCNFHLRGEESDRDEAFVRSLCEKHQIPLDVQHFQTEAYAAQHGISIEMAARELRYDWFRELKRKYNAQTIVVGHHLDDQVETMLLNLVRGTGIHGLTGMRVCNDQGIVRPLIRLRRAEIEDWLTAQGQTWVTDSTNLDPEAASRNKIRLQVLPLLEQVNPSVVTSLASTMQHLSAAEQIYQRGLETELAKVCPTHDYKDIDIAALQQSASPEAILFERLHPLGFASSQIADILSGLQGEAGAIWHSPTWRLLRDRGHLILQELSDEQQYDWPLELPAEGIVALPYSMQLNITTIAYSKHFEIPREPNTACFDIDKLNLPLRVRHIKTGDRMHPFGMRGTRLVSDILTDHKLSRFERERQLVVVSGEEIIWLVGIRVAAGYAIDNSTRGAMIITCAFSV